MTPESRRWLAFATSVACHIGLTVFLVWVDSTVASERAVARQFEAVLPPSSPTEHKLVWYKLDDSTPAITPDQTLDRSQTPRGELSTSHKVLIAEAEQAKSVRQIIREPDHPEPLPIDVPAPNLVALASLLPKIHKEFVAPPSAGKQDAAVALADAPPVLVDNSATPKDPLASLRPTKMPPKPFIAPKPQGGAQRGSGTGQQDLPAPPSIAAPDSGVEALILGLAPAVAPLPAGSRTGQFAEANLAGVPSSGTIRQPGSVVVPGITASGNTGQATAPKPDSGLTTLPERRVVREIVLAGVNRTMSVPLRPSSRVIPASVEAQFTDRNVYTLVLPSPGLRQYPNDWIMWFSERQQGSQPGTSMRAPIPARKYLTEEPDTAGIPPTLAVLEVSLIIDRNGRVVSPRVLKGAPTEALRITVLAELATWEFEPARRNGIAVDVDAVMEIPMQLPGVSRSGR